MAKTMMRAVVVDDGDGRVHVRLSVTDEHVARCPTCLSLYALRLSSAFLNAIEELRSDDAEEDTADEPSQHALH
jgi:hypothetical protein